MSNDNIVNNPDIDLLWREGNISSAMDQSIHRDSSPDDRLRKILSQKDSDRSIEDISYAALTLGDLLYNYLRINPEVVKAVSFSRSDDLNNIFNFALFAQQQERLFGEARTGSVNQIQGYLAERIVAHHLMVQGHDVSFPAIPNQKGWDIRVDGHPFQIKCLENVDGVHEHFQHFDYPVIVNADLAGHLQNLHHVYIDPQLWHDKVRSMTENSLQHGADMNNAHIPWISVITSAPIPLYRWYKSDTDAAGAITIILTDTTGRIAGGLTGSQVTAAVGVLLFGPAGAVVGTSLGSILGARVGRGLAKVARRVLTKSEEDAVKHCASQLAGDALDCWPTKDRAWAEKGEALNDNFIGANKQKEAVRDYLVVRHKDEIAYLRNQARQINDFRQESSSLDPLEAWKKILILVKRAGIHPEFIQGSLERLEQLVNELIAARKRLLIK